MDFELRDDISESSLSLSEQDRRSRAKTKELGEMLIGLSIRKPALRDALIANGIVEKDYYTDITSDSSSDSSSDDSYLSSVFSSEDEELIDQEIQLIIAEEQMRDMIDNDVIDENEIVLVKVPRNRIPGEIVESTILNDRLNRKDRLKSGCWCCVKNRTIWKD